MAQEGKQGKIGEPGQPAGGQVSPKGSAVGTRFAKGQPALEPIVDNRSGDTTSSCRYYRLSAQLDNESHGRPVSGGGKTARGEKPR